MSGQDCECVGSTRLLVWWRADRETVIQSKDGGDVSDWTMTVQHTLSLAQEVPYPDGVFVCNLCFELGTGSVYHCSSCDYDVHVHCAAIETDQTHFSHYEHPLQLYRIIADHTCDGCGEAIEKWSFRCNHCDVDMHDTCVRAPRFINHPSHPHTLSYALLTEPYICKGCHKSAEGYVYRCDSCHFHLHQSCARLPSKLFSHPSHRRHDLCLFFEPPEGEPVVFNCDRCLTKGIGWRYWCNVCSVNLHPSCAGVSHELPHLKPMHDYSVNPTPKPREDAPDMQLHSGDLEVVERILKILKQRIGGSSHIP